MVCRRLSHSCHVMTCIFVLIVWAMILLSFVRCAFRARIFWCNFLRILVRFMWKAICLCFVHAHLVIPYALSSLRGYHQYQYHLQYPLQPDQQYLWHLSYRTHARMASSGNLTPGMPSLCNHKYLCSIGQVCVCTYNQCGKLVLWFTIGQGAKQAVNCAIPGRASGDHCVHTVIIACTLDYVPLVSREKGGLQSQGPALSG